MFAYQADNVFPDCVGVGVRNSIFNDKHIPPFYSKNVWLNCGAFQTGIISLPTRNTIEHSVLKGCLNEHTGRMSYKVHRICL